MVGRGKVNEEKPKSVESPLDEANADMLDKLKSTIEEIEQATSEGAKMTTKDFAERIKTLQNIVELGYETKNGIKAEQKEYGEDYQIISRDFFEYRPWRNVRRK